MGFGICIIVLQASTFVIFMFKPDHLFVTAMLTRYLKVVPMNSAIMDGYISIGIHNNHRGMTRFGAESNPDFSCIVRELQR